MTKTVLLVTGFSIAACGLVNASEAAPRFTCKHDGDSIRVATSNYVLQIEKQGFRYGFYKPSGEAVAPAHAESGLEFGGANAAETFFRNGNHSRIQLEVVNTSGGKADVEIMPSERYIRFSIKPRGIAAGRIIARTGGVSPAFGLGDLGVRKRDRTELTGYTNDDFHGDGAQCGRLISNFAIFPQHDFAEVNVEPTSKIIRLTADENAQGTKSATAMPALYYFVGKPDQIYASFLEVRNRAGYQVFKPKYEWFGVGWEAFGALAWDTNEKTVTENVERYLSLGYPLSWMVVGSGFWPRQDARFLATTSFGLWDTNLYPHPREFIEHFHQRGLKFNLGLRISFITNGPFASEGVKGGYFIKENGDAKVFRIAFPKSPCYLLDAQNPAAVRWYMGLCGKWRKFGVDGFKEDLFGYGKYQLRDDKIDPVNAALMNRGVYVMGRNGYLGSPMDLHRFEDFNFDQWQDRGPLNGLAFAYSGFPYVYPDIVGGTFGEGRKMPPLTDPMMHAYMMRNAQYASVNPSMSLGKGPWELKSPKVEQVMLAAAQLHARLQPYIYSAAVDAFETGFPHTLTPLPLAWPEDPEVYRLENAQRRGYEWMLGPSLLACPLYGNDYPTAETRDVYLPAGQWMDYDTGELYKGPQTLKGFALPPGKTPLFVGGKGIVIERSLEPPSKPRSGELGFAANIQLSRAKMAANTSSPLRQTRFERPSLDKNKLFAVVYSIAPRGGAYRFTHPDGRKRNWIRSDVVEWDVAQLTVTDVTSNKTVAFESVPRTRAIRFAIVGGHNYTISARSKPGRL